jgi:hypothetical protein
MKNIHLNFSFLLNLLATLLRGITSVVQGNYSIIIILLLKCKSDITKPLPGKTKIKPKILTYYIYAILNENALFFY